MAGGSGEKFCLRWNDFETSISRAFQELREDKDFFDVTLACEGSQVQAHKVILSACSPFFRTVLRKNPHQHPLLYLKGVKYDDIVSVLNFMYHGEVNIAQEALNNFLAVAEDLKVKGLTQTDKDPDQQPSKPQLKRPLETEAEPRPQKQQRSINYERSETKQITPTIKTEMPVVYECEPEFEEPTELVEANFEAETEDYDFEQGYNDQTGQFHQQDRIGNDQQGIHSFSRSTQNKQIYSCELCYKTFSNKNSLANHNKIHEGKTTCPVCSKVFGSKSNLNVHIKNSHKDLIDEGGFMLNSH